MFAYPYSTNPSWADVTPVPEPEFSPPVVRIIAPANFLEAMSYFRAILRSDEQSERALSLTADVITHNVANYSAWQHRLKCLRALKRDLSQELTFVAELSVSRAKCYQVWQHRRAVCSEIGAAAASQEIAATAQYLQSDTKNYHCWSYRQWLLRFFATADVLLDELRWCAAQLAMVDCRNNSQWNQRYFLLNRCFPGALSNPAIVAAEVRFTLSLIKKVALNESAWVYLDLLVRSPGFTDWDLVAYACLCTSAHPPLGLPLHDSVLAAHAPPVPFEGGECCNRFAHSTLLELLLNARCPALDLLALARAGGPGEAAVAAAAAVGKTVSAASGSVGVFHGVDVAGTAVVVEHALVSREPKEFSCKGSSIKGAESESTGVCFPVDPSVCFGFPSSAGGLTSVRPPAEGADALSLLSRAAEQCEVLVRGDPVRVRYWRHRLAMVEAVADAERQAFGAAPPAPAPALAPTSAAAGEESEDSEAGESDAESGIDEDDLAAAGAVAADGDDAA